MENICLCEGLGAVPFLRQRGWSEITVSLAPLLVGVCFTRQARTSCSRFAEALGGRVGCDPIKLAGLGIVTRPVSEAAAQVVKRRRVKSSVIVGGWIKRRLLRRCARRYADLPHHRFRTT